MFNTYIVMSKNKKYYGSFVLEDGDKQREDYMKQHFQKALNKNTVELVKCHSTPSKALAKNVCGAMHEAIVNDVLHVNSSNSEEVKVAKIVSDCIGKISKNKFGR